MLLFALRRILLWFPSLIALLFAIYLIAFYGVGDPIKLIFLRSPGDVAFDPVRVEAMRVAAGLDQPVLVQFWHYLTHLARGNFGNSLITGRSVGPMLIAALPVTLQLGLATMVLTALTAVPLGIWAALREGSLADRIIRGAALLLWALPPYVVGPLMLVAALLLFPQLGVSIGWHGLFDVRTLLPLAVLMMQPVALILRQTRNATLEVLAEPYIRTVIAKGLPQRLILTRHVLRAILTPVVTQLGLITITLINGAVFVELVFGLPGLGRLTVTAVTEADYPLILGVAFFGTLAVMTTNLLIELLYPLLDPRVPREMAA